MFSLDNFYYVLHANFLQPFRMVDAWFSTFNFDSFDDLIIDYYSKKDPTKCNSMVIFYDQEPLIPAIFNDIMYHPRTFSSLARANTRRILANSEISDLKTQVCRELGLYDWYYFFHGLAALEWYRDFKYVPRIDNQFTKVFITFNHLVTKDRSYRLNLIASILEKGLDHHGLISCQLGDNNGTWRDEILSPSSKLSVEAKKRIYMQFSKLKDPYILDVHDDSYNMCSARLNIPLQQQALWHLVTETVFYYDKLHLTEKVFQPIVARRPFMLVGGQGNLAYLKRYGFKTFDCWVDESYDNEVDPDLRIKKIVAELDRLSKMSVGELNTMYAEMQDTLDFNFNHFYGEFKSIVISEMIGNFEKCLKQLNVGAFPENVLDVKKFDARAVYTRLLQ